VHFQALISGSICVTIFVASLTILITVAPTVFAANTEEYPTHHEIMEYMNQENSRVAVLQANQMQVMDTIKINQGIIASNSERISLLENNMSALMKMAWATLIGVFSMFGKSMFEIYQRASMASVRKARRVVVENENDLGVD
jgi:hypothetical protein